MQSGRTEEEKLRDGIGNYDDCFSYHLDKPSDEDITNNAQKQYTIADQFLNNSDQKVAEKLYGDKGKDPAYPKDARVAFLNYLEKIRNNPDTDFKGNKTTSVNDQVSMHGLFKTAEDPEGKIGVALYKAALEEEQNDPAFRRAVFAKALQQHDGPSWKNRVVLWIGGPSASGKTFGSQEVLKTMKSIFRGKDKDKYVNNDDKGNIIAFVDGGIEREMSQMRRIIVSVAREKGHPSIRDLEDHSGVLNVKKYIQKAADAAKDPPIHLAIPSTFTNPKHLKKLLAYARNKQVRQVFSQVTGGPGKQGAEDLADTTKYQGETRASAPPNQYGAPDPATEKPSLSELLKQKPDVESKEYEPENFEPGKKLSTVARKMFQRLTGGIFIKVRNDSIYVVHDEQQNCMRKYKEGDTATPIRVTRRLFDEWKAVEQQHQNQTTLKKTFDIYVKAHKMPALIEVYKSKERIEIPTNTDAKAEATPPTPRTASGAQRDIPKSNPQAGQPIPNPPENNTNKQLPLPPLFTNSIAWEKVARAETLLITYLDKLTKENYDPSVKEKEQPILRGMLDELTNLKSDLPAKNSTLPITRDTQSKLIDLAKRITDTTKNFPKPLPPTPEHKSTMSFN